MLSVSPLMGQRVDRKSKIMIGLYAWTILWVLGILAAMMWENFALVGIPGLLLGVWQIRFRHELAAHYRKARRLQSGQRASYE